MNNRIIALLFFIVIGCLGSLSAQTGKPMQSIFNKMQYDDVVKVKLVLPLDSIMNNRRSENKFAGEWSFADSAGTVSAWDVKVNIRGKYRRMKCVDVPPLKVTFDKKTLKSLGLSKYNDYKIVNYCGGDSKKDRELLLKEYLSYKLYNELTEISYQVVLLEIEYVDIISKKSKTQTAFLIEDTAHLRNRVDAKKSKKMYGIKKTDLHPEYQQCVALFEAMIGNNDWAFNGSKNIKYIERDSLLIPVPYDFDFSGIVNASYAKASFQNRLHDKLDIAPIYHGFEKDYTSIKKTLRFFNGKKKSLYTTLNNFELLSKSSRNQMRSYLDTFFNNYRGLVFAANE